MSEPIVMGNILETIIVNEIAVYGDDRDPRGKLTYDVLIEEFWRDRGIDRFAKPSTTETFAIVE
jgi:hypothetical protein